MSELDALRRSVVVSARMNIRRLGNRFEVREMVAAVAGGEVVRIGKCEDDEISDMKTEIDWEVCCKALRFSQFLKENHCAERTVCSSETGPLII